MTTAPPASFQPPANMLDWALLYAKRGWYVLPVHSMRDGQCSCGNKTCGSPAKHPRTKHGEKDATNDPGEIERWWRRWPDANIAIATGPCGLVALDIDGPDGLALFHKVSGGDHPKTLMAKTGREGGFHVFYAGTSIPSSQVTGEHLDVRGSTGYVVVAPSRHANGAVYTWANLDQPIAPVPAWAAPWVASRSGGKGQAAPVAAGDKRPAHIQHPDVDFSSKLGAALSAVPYSPYEATRLRSALFAIPPNIDGRAWASIGAILHDLKWHVDGQDIGLEIWDEWSKTSTGKGAGNGEYRGRADLEKRWRSFERDYAGPRTTVGTIYYMAGERGWTGNEVPASKVEAKSDPGIFSEPCQPASPTTGPSDGVISAADLRQMSFEPVRWVLTGIIPEGLTLLVGRPKVGKSWWALDLCVACATGRTAFGTVPTLQGDVLYLALEDGKRRLQRRLDRLLSPFKGEWPNRLSLAPMGSWPRGDQGGLEKIEAWCGSVQKPALIVVDTLERIRKPATGKTPLYAADYEAIATLQKIATKFSVAIVVLHHDRKSEADDAFDTVSGTLGLTGAADTILLIKRRPNGVVLYARGRDIEESETAMEFEKETCRWTILGKASEVHRSNERARVIAALKSATQPLAVREIMIDAEMRTRNATDSLLSKMVSAGEIERAAKGRYRLPGEKPGKIGQTERSNGQAIDSADRKDDLSHLSDLTAGCAKNDPRPDFPN